jgi:molybdate transport system substrate-binding protein
VRRSAAILAVVAAVSLAACSSSTGGAPTTSAPAPSSTSSSMAASGSITVFAASSLKGSFAEIATAFEAANPGTTVTYNFGPSSGLATQITQGAPADVFAAASTKTMDTVTTAGAASNPQVFATNTMEIATPASGGASVMSLADLATAGVKVAVCQKDVPCGVAAQKLFDQNKVTVTPSTEEVDVKAVLSKVELGEVDAGIVYVTDVKAAGDKVKGIEIPADQNVTTKYPIAPIGASKNAATAQAFVDFVLSPAGQSILAGAGFAAP